MRTMPLLLFFFSAVCGELADAIENNNVLLRATASYTSASNQPVRFTDAAVAHDKFAAASASVVGPSPNARFTVLTNRVIRMEWRDDTSKGFEDRPTLAIVQRKTPPPVFDQFIRDGVLTIQTLKLVLTYEIGKPFGPTTLIVVPRHAKIAGEVDHFTTWRFGDTGKSDHIRNLKGTVFGLDMQTVLDLDCTKIKPLAHATSWGREGKDRGIHQNDIMCEWGLISRSGWSIVDDANNMVIDPSTDWWVGTPGTSNHDAIDQYLFAHGLDFKAALKDYRLIGGRSPLPPKFSMGTMWDRWYDVDAADTDKIVDDYAMRTMPLDTFVFDRNFRDKSAGDFKSFDPEMFPDPALVLSKLHGNGVGVVLNMHDCGGIRPDEPEYEEAMKTLGFSEKQAEAKLYVNGDAHGTEGYCLSQTFANAVDDVILGPMEEDGVDGWMNDWGCDGPDQTRSGDHHQGCKGGKMSPTMWYNRHRYTAKRRRHITRVEKAIRKKKKRVSTAELAGAIDAASRGSPNEERGFVLAKFGGLGSHRYPMGYSGDVEIVSWETLQFSIYMTSTSSNAAYGVWSHDILGSSTKMVMKESEVLSSFEKEEVSWSNKASHTRHEFAKYYATYELGTRWLQWGAFSPVLRTHDRGTSAGGCSEKHWPSAGGDCAQVRPWNVPPKFFKANRLAMRMRAELVPYIYTAYRTLYDTGVPLLRPMYYEFPHSPAAYARPMQATPDTIRDSGDLSDAAERASWAKQTANQVVAKKKQSNAAHRLRRRQLKDSNLRVNAVLQEAQSILTASSDAANDARFHQKQAEGRSEFQFMFGDDLLVAPVVSAANQWNETMGKVDIWFPPGGWIERHSGALFTGAPGSGTLRTGLRYHLNEIPVFVRANAMIATLPLFDGSHTSAARGDSGGSTVGTAQRDYDHLVFTIHLDGTSYVPGKASTKTFTTSVYEDDGQSTAYLHDGLTSHSAKTTAEYTSNRDKNGGIDFTIATKGTYPNLPKRRTVTLRIRNAVPTKGVRMRVVDQTPGRAKKESHITVPLCIERGTGARHGLSHNHAIGGMHTGVLGYTGERDYPHGCVQYVGTEGTLLVTVPNVPTHSLAKVYLYVDFGNYASALPSMPGMRGAIEHARLAKSVLDEAGANPAGQCCESPNEQPLKKLATFGMALDSMSLIRWPDAYSNALSGYRKGFEHMPKPQTSAGLGDFTAKQVKEHEGLMLDSSNDFPDSIKYHLKNMVIAATDEMRALFGEHEAALHVLKAILMKRVGASKAAGKNPTEIRKGAIVAISKSHHLDIGKDLRHLSNVQLAMQYGDKAMLESASRARQLVDGKTFVSMNAGSFTDTLHDARHLTRERLLHALALMETAQDRMADGATE